MSCVQNKPTIVAAAMVSITAAGILAGHAHGAELAAWWTLIGSAVSISLWGWLRGRRPDQHDAPTTGTTHRLSEAVNPDEYAAHMINCADLESPPTTRVPAPRPARADPDSTVEATDLVSGHSSEWPALFHCSQSYVGTTTLAPTADDLSASLNRVMPG